MNTFMQNLKASSIDNLTYTTNGAKAHKSTGSRVYDLFALGGAYRQRGDDDVYTLFKNAFYEDEVLALRCLFYLRDVRGGQGERRFFRVCLNRLARENSSAVLRNLKHIPTFGRWDDLYALIDTPLQSQALDFMKEQFILDLKSETPSLLGKWLKSENTSSEEARRLANITRKYFNISHKRYRKALSLLRERINVVERLISAGKWDEIEFDKIPSGAGLKYKNAFARHDVERMAAGLQTYADFISNDDAKVNAKTLYPYNLVHQARNCFSSLDAKAIEVFWKNLKDYFNGKSCNMLTVCDTSGSMTWSSRNAVAPIDIAVSIAIYTAERLNGPFKDSFVSFSRNPRLITLDREKNFVDNVKRIVRLNECANTDLVKTFRFLKDIALRSKAEDIPEVITVISDMQIDEGSYFRNNNELLTEMEKMRMEWTNAGLKFPKMIYWNVNAINDTVLDVGDNVTLVSGASPVIFEQVMSGKTGYDLMLDKINSDRYTVIQ